AIRKVTPVGVVTTLAGLAQFDQFGNPIGGSADGTGSAARFSAPSGVAVDSGGNGCAAGRGNKAIRKVTPAGAVTALASGSGSGDGIGSAARFNTLSPVAVDIAGSGYVADLGNNTIQKVTPVGTDWVVTTLAGLGGLYGSAEGTGSAARFRGPAGAAVDTN